MRLSKMNKFVSYHPTKFHFGDGSLELLTDVIREHGTRVLLVRSPVIESLKPLYERVEKLILASGAELFCFSDVEPNPTTNSIAKAGSQAYDAGVDVIVALGGGSAIDTAKAAALEGVYGKSCWEFRFGSDTQPGPETLPVIAIPTTAGTGSEATPIAVVSNEDENYKSIIWSDHIACKVALIDPSLTHTMPAKLTAETGFDAFAHCFESYISNTATPMASIYALEGMRLVANSLVKAVTNPGDKQARADMMMAATLGGMAITESGVTLPHGMGMAIGGFSHSISHGASMAIVYPEIIARSVLEGSERYATVAKLFKPELKDDAAHHLPEIILNLLKQIDLTPKLSDYGLTSNMLKDIARASYEQPGWQAHPKIHSEIDMYEILQECL